MRKALSQPSIFEYKSAIEFMEDVYEFRKKKEPGFSYEKWARELGYKSRGFLKMLVSRRRKITPRFAENFCCSMNFNNSEKSYFRLLSAYDHAKNADEMAAYLNKIFEFSGRLKNVKTVTDDAFVGNPVLLHLFTLLGFADFEGTVESISTITGVDVPEVEIILQNLKELGLAENENNTWKATSDSFNVPTDPGSEFLKSYHTHTMQEAAAAQQMDKSLRRFRSLLLSLSEEEFSEIIDHMESFISQNVGRYDSKRLKGRRLYKMNINIYPITLKNN